MTNKKSQEKSRAFACVLYQDSALPEWQQVIEEMHLQAFSIFHDRDINPDGEVKKPHWHLLVYWHGPTTYDHVKRTVFEVIHGVPEPKPVVSFRGYARYLRHMDNPEKAQYQRECIHSYGGLDYDEVIKLPTDDDAATIEMIDFIRKYNVCFFSDFVDYAARYNIEWFKVLSHSRTLFIKEYIKSIGYSNGDTLLPHLEIDVAAAIEGLTDPQSRPDECPPEGSLDGIRKAE